MRSGRYRWYGGYVAGGLLLAGKVHGRKSCDFVIADVHS